MLPAIPSRSGTADEHPVSYNTFSKTQSHFVDRGQLEKMACTQVVPEEVVSVADLRIVEAPPQKALGVENCVLFTALDLCSNHT